MKLGRVIALALLVVAAGLAGCAGGDYSTDQGGVGNPSDADRDMARDTQEREEASRGNESVALRAG